MYKLEQKKMPRAYDSLMKYPWHELEVAEEDEDGCLVGLSFFVPIEDKAHMRQYAYRKGIEFGKRFSVRKVTENGVIGYRVWRVE